MTPDELEKLQQRIKDAENEIHRLPDPDDDFRWLAEKMRLGNEKQKEQNESDEIKTVIDESYLRGLQDILACAKRRTDRMRGR